MRNVRFLVFIALAIGVLVLNSPDSTVAAQDTVEVIPYQATGYRFSIYGWGTVPPDYGSEAFDDSAFSTGDGAFGSHGSCPLQSTVATTWPSDTELVVRRVFNLPAGATDLRVMVVVDNDVEVFLNGVNISDGLVVHENCPVLDELEFTVPDEVLRAGDNLLAVHAVDRAVESFLDLRVLLGPPPPPSHRKVLFIQGYISGTQCVEGKTGFIQDDAQPEQQHDRVESTRAYLRGGVAGAADGAWVRDYVTLQDSDFVYFSYSLGYCPPTDWHGQRPLYSDPDTCWSIDPLSSGNPGRAHLLNSLVDALIADDPDVQIDILAHSQGGLVAAYWLASEESADDRSHIHSLVTFDSPLGGLSSDSETGAYATCDRKGVDYDGWVGFGRYGEPYDSPGDMGRRSATVSAAQGAPAFARVYTIRDPDFAVTYDEGTFWATLSSDRCADQFNDGKGTRCGNVVDFYEDFGGHSNLWTSPTSSELGMAGCALTEATFCYSQQVDNIPLMQGEPGTALASVPEDSQSATFRTSWDEGAAAAALADSGSNNVSTTLTAPDGTPIGPDTPGITHHKGSTYEIYEVDSPLAGDWTINLYGADLPPEGETVTVEASTVPLPPPDADGDTIGDADDNCVDTINWDQRDTDEDGWGDACDADDDDDAVDDLLDNCPLTANADQLDADADGLGDICDGDNDNDDMGDDYEASTTCLEPLVNDAALDADVDDLLNLPETLFGTDPCDPDSDDDAFNDGAEMYLGTDPLDDCRDDPSDDAWPLDVSMDAQLSVVGDVLNFRDRIGATPGAPNWWQRLDFNGDGQLSVVGDVLMYRNRIGETCT